MVAYTMARSDNMEDKKECTCGCRSGVKTCDCSIIHKEDVAHVKENMLDSGIIDLIAGFYKALADNTRLRIVHALDTKELCVCDLSSLLNMTKSAISHQLAYLKKEGLVEARKQGKEVFYTLKDRHVQDVFEISLAHIKEQLDETNN